MKIISWWSGGVTSAIACKLGLDLYSNVELIFIDTFNEDPDTYRFKKDCEKWYNKEIKTISAIPDKYKSIKDVWFKYNSLNVATGAICSTELKREVREAYQKTVNFSHQIFGFDIDENKRAKMLSKNHKDSKPVYPLLMYALSKKDCIDILIENNIDVPITYKYGFLNNNCFKTGCVQGGIGYWQKMQRDFIDKFNNMAKIEHELTDLKGKPVTMLKDQSNTAKESGAFQVFLKPHPNYPKIKDISMIKGREPKPLLECNGFCGTNDLLPINETEKEINFQTELF